MMMEQHENVFGTKKPLIGCLHMAALPGSYYADPTMTYRGLRCPDCRGGGCGFNKSLWLWGSH